MALTFQLANPIYLLNAIDKFAIEILLDLRSSKRKRANNTNYGKSIIKRENHIILCPPPMKLCLTAVFVGTTYKR